MRIHAKSMEDPAGYDVFDLATGAPIRHVIEIDSATGSVTRHAPGPDGKPLMDEAGDHWVEVTETRQFRVVGLSDGAEVCRTARSIMDHLRF